LVGQATFLETYAGNLPGSDILVHCKSAHAPGVYDGWLGDPACRLWVAETREGGAPVGYAALTPSSLQIDPRDDDLELKRIYLLHRFHGLGLGAGLMAAALAHARAAGAGRLLLGVWGGNSKAMAFYTRQGFVVAGPRRFRVGANVYDDLVLALDLDAA
jgi:GNAT superfamily N-acetyltransferase